MRLIDADALLAVSCILLAIVSIFQSWQIYKLERRTSEMRAMAWAWWKPVRLGRWESVGDDEPWLKMCSECKTLVDNPGTGWNYCPNCGARMNGKE